MQGLLAVIIGYLFGCQSMAMKVSKRHNTDVRETGSKNLGASNVVLMLGWKAGIVTGLHDILKAFLAVIVAKRLFPRLVCAGVLAGVGAILGHMFPAHLGFRGGKGVACYYGAMLGLNWKFGLFLLAVIIPVVLITDYIVMGAVTIACLSPIYMGLIERSVIGMLLLCAVTALVCYKHQENFRRIAVGQEARVKAAMRGEYKEYQMK